MGIVKRIQILCAQSGTTLIGLERNLNLSRGSIRKWDANSPSGEKLLSVSKYFGVTIEYLLGEKDYKDSVPYLFVKKLLSDTEKKAIEWSLIEKYEKDHQPDDHPQKYEYPISLFKFDANECVGWQDGNYFFNKDDTYFCKYKSGGYLLGKLIPDITTDVNPEKNAENLENKNYVYALYVFFNDQFNLYSTSKTLPLIENLFPTVVNQARGVDDFINNYLSGD